MYPPRYVFIRELDDFALPVVHPARDFFVRKSYLFAPTASSDRVSPCFFASRRTFLARGRLFLVHGELFWLVANFFGFVADFFGSRRTSGISWRTFLGSWPAFLGRGELWGELRGAAESH